MMQEIEGFLRGLIRDEMRAVVQETRGAGVTDMLTLAEAGQVANVHTATVRAWIRGEQLHAHGKGKMTRIKRADLQALLERGPKPKARPGAELTPEEAARADMILGG